MAAVGTAVPMNAVRFLRRTITSAADHIGGRGRKA
jgi:hypothetical protein